MASLVVVFVAEMTTAGGVLEANLNPQRYTVESRDCNVTMVETVKFP